MEKSTPVNPTKPSVAVAPHQDTRMSSNAGDYAADLSRIESQPHESSKDTGELRTAFSRRTRIFIITMTGFASFFSPLSGQIYFPAIPELAADYNTSIGNINLIITISVILQGLDPTIMGIFGDVTGHSCTF
ncbi:hypothetical protein LTS18_000179 [Coniosporium uncinatum]|uniref:Uncharacterized protein n=1 Tax=Coniosporium uncinatum TaxID=93489 RepID=A0ACC3DV37_9PEZI|nr:hypothetical protein LTS18_000179 [Coniosporium uncinatum]